MSDRMNVLGRGCGTPLLPKWDSAALPLPNKQQQPCRWRDLARTPCQALSDTPDVGGCYQVGDQNTQSRVPSEWEGWGLGLQTSWVLC